MIVRAYSFCAEVSMLNSIMVKLESDGNVISLKTISRKRGKSSRFLLNKKMLADWLRADTGIFYDADIYSYAQANHLDNGNAMFRVCWLSGSEEALHGYVERFEVAKEVLRQLIELDGLSYTVLYTEMHKAPSFDFSYALRSLQTFVSDPSKRRALSKALRDLGWRDTHFRMYNDMPYGFGFTTDGRHPIHGGLILHHSERERGNGVYPYLYFGVHT